MENSLDKTLNRIIETDKISREQVKEKKQRLISIDTEISEAKNAIDEELYAQSQKNIAKATETAEIKLKKEISRIDSFFSEAEQKLRTSFEENSESISEKIFKSIVE